MDEQETGQAPPAGYRVFGARKTPKYHLVPESSIELDDWTALCGVPVNQNRKTGLWTADSDTFCVECADRVP
jgi:hypothetical protein